MIDADPDILTLDEVACYLRVTKRTLYRLAQEGQLPAFKLGGVWRFRRAELDQWIAENTGKRTSTT
ncbi:MAG: AlpA family transcriptional regulator [Azoarcus sp.]|jgi:excisionase family DNA binding protein|nr:MAG: AlpA family transcriptional regulator [Azoarcus sp.]TVT54822.1 MAG: helix-turn-helix domain-containing protein [Azoarcus sp. PHD]